MVKPPALISVGDSSIETEDFIGRSMAAPRFKRCKPFQLVGVRPLDPAIRLRAGAHISAIDGPTNAMNDQGYLTFDSVSPCFSPGLRWDLLATGASRGEKVRACDPLRGAMRSLKL